MNALRTLVPGVYTRTQRLAGIALFIAFILANQISIGLFISPTVIALASGIALGGLVLGGIELWPFVYFAALLSLAFNGASPLSLLILPVAQTLQAALGTFIFSQLRFDPLMRHLNDFFIIMGVAFVSSAIVPTLGLLTQYLNILIGNPPMNMPTWGMWWAGHIMSLLILAPLIIRWGAEPKVFYLSTVLKRERVIETGTVLTALLIITIFLTWTPYTQVGGVALVYFLLVPLFWLAIRIGSRFITLGLFALTAIMMAGAFFGPMAPGAEELGKRLFQLEIFAIILAVIFYIITGLQEERTQADKSLTSYIEKLEDALNRLSLQDRAKNDFIAVLAHELRNPLAPIVSTIELLRINHPKTREERESFELIDNRLKAIQRLLDDLLDVSRISRSKLKLKKESVDLRMVIQHSIQAIEHQIKNRGQTLVIDVPNEALMLQADPVRLEQIITNLLSNASKFTDQGGRIVIEIAREENVARVSVIDNGIGIDPAMLTRIFEPFLQLESGEHRSEGLGIGLSLTQKLVEMHEGTIEAKSSGLMQGSEFVVLLPIIPTYESTPPTREYKPAAPKMARIIQTVLIVDDNAVAAHGIGKLLLHLGYTVSYAYTGREAKEKISKLNPDAVVLDIGLPDMDGYDLAKMLRTGMEYKGMLIALTGYGQEEDRQRAYETGFNHHLTKPITIDELHQLLRVSASK